MGRDVRLVSHQQDRLPLAVERVEQHHDLLARGAVEVAGRFVGEQDTRPVHQRPGDRHPLPLASRELVGPVQHAVLEPHACQRVSGQLPALAPAHPGVDQGQLDVVQRRGPREQVERLEHEADLLVADPRELVVAQFRDPVAVEPVFAAGRAVQAADHVHEGGLPRARRAHDGDELVLPDDEIHAAERVHHLAPHVVVPLELPGHDDGIAG